MAILLPATNPLPVAVARPLVTVMVPDATPPHMPAVNPVPVAMADPLVTVSGGLAVVLHLYPAFAHELSDPLHVCSRVQSCCTAASHVARLLGDGSNAAISATTPIA